MVYTETPEVHMHTLKSGVLDVSDVDGYDFDLFRAYRPWRRFAISSSTSR